MITNNAIDSNIPIEITKGGTAQASLANHSVLVGNGTSGITQIPAGVTNTVLLGNTGSDPSFGPLPAAGITNGSNGQLLIGGGSAPAWATVTAGSNITLTPGANSLTVGLSGTSPSYAIQGLWWQGVPFFTGFTTGWANLYGSVFATTGTWARFTVPATGYYKLSMVQLVNSSSLSQCGVQIGSANYIGGFYNNVFWTTGNLSAPVHVYLTAGDQIYNINSGFPQPGAVGRRTGGSNFYNTRMTASAL